MAPSILWPVKKQLSNLLNSIKATTIGRHNVDQRDQRWIKELKKAKDLIDEKISKTHRPTPSPSICTHTLLLYSTLTFSSTTLVIKSHIRPNPLPSNPVTFNLNTL